ncbi:MAG TPA: T6SS immunity protein Tdi1 domain-containing protein [Pirellulaceae bacterium]|nr:T6SS immunity protein Tdi1 domain-containing protein [Pirellulaceae bacterium]
MMLSVDDYLIDQRGFYWPKLLESWAWLLPGEFTVWLVNRYAELFLVLPDGTVHWLETDGGSFTKVAESRDDFSAKIDEDDNAKNWLMIPLVDRCVAAGLTLGPGQCYGFKYPTILGGDFTVENTGVLAIGDYLGSRGSIHEQLRDVPDGQQVILEIVNRPTSRLPGGTS